MSEDTVIQELVTDGEYMVMECHDRIGFCEAKVHGPFETIKKARSFIKDHVCEPCLKTHDLHEGKNKDWGSKYIIAKVEQTLCPVPNIKVMVNLEKSTHVAEEYIE